MFEGIVTLEKSYFQEEMGIAPPLDSGFFIESKIYFS